MDSLTCTKAESILCFSYNPLEENNNDPVTQCDIRKSFIKFEEYYMKVWDTDASIYT